MTRDLEVVSQVDPWSLALVTALPKCANNVGEDLQEEVIVPKCFERETSLHHALVRTFVSTKTFDLDSDRFLYLVRSIHCYGSDQ